MADLRTVEGAKQVATRPSITDELMRVLGVHPIGLVTCVGDDATGRRGCGDDALAWGMTSPKGPAQRRRAWLYNVVMLDSSELTRDYLASAENVAWLLRATQSGKLRMRTAPGADTWRFFDLDAEYPSVAETEGGVQTLLQQLRGLTFTEQRTHMPVGHDAVQKAVGDGFYGFVNDILEGVYDEFTLFEVKSNSAHDCPARRTVADFDTPSTSVQEESTEIDIDPDA